MNEFLALKGGCETVFKKVYQTNYNKLYFYIFSKTGSEYVAEEVVQMTFVKLWSRRAKITDTVPIDVQLFRIARSVLVDELRKEQVRLRSLANESYTPFTDSLLNSIECKDLVHHINETVDRLPKVQKLVYRMSREQGLSHEEIAHMLSLSPKTIENHIAKVLRQLKEAVFLFFL